MKKLIFAVLALLVGEVAFADTCSKNLTGPAFTPAQAIKLCSAFGSGVLVLKNNTYLSATDAAGTGSISVLKVDATDDTVLNADTGDVIKLSVAGTNVFQVQAAGVRPAIDGDNTTANLGASNAGWKNLYLSDATNRAQLLVSNGLYIDAPSGQSMFLRVGGSDLWSIASTGTLIGSGTGSIGWAVVDGTDNTACTAQCTTPAVFGFNLSAGATAPTLVGPSDATADICMCAGAS